MAGIGLRVVRRGALAVRQGVNSAPTHHAHATPLAVPAPSVGSNAHSGAVDERRWGSAAVLLPVAQPMSVPVAVAAAWGAEDARPRSASPAPVLGDWVAVGDTRGFSNTPAGRGASLRWEGARERRHAPRAGARSFTSVAQQAAPDDVGAQPPPPGAADGRETVGQLFSELRGKSGRGKTPSAALLHRLLRKVRNGDELALGVRALELCATRFVPFSHHTSALVLDACVRAGDLERAVALLQRHVDFRMFAIGRETYHRVLIAASTARDVEAFDRVLGELRRSVHEFVPKTVHICVRAYVDFDDLPRALDVYEEAVASAVEVRRGTLNVLTNGIVEAPTLPVERPVLRAVVEATAAVNHDTSRDLAARAAARLDSYEAEEAARAAAAVADSASEGEASDAEGADGDESDAEGSSASST